VVFRSTELGGSIESLDGALRPGERALIVDAGALLIRT